MRKAFTAVEIVIVLVIIGILTLMAAPAYFKVVDGKAKKEAIAKQISYPNLEVAIAALRKDSSKAEMPVRIPFTLEGGTMVYERTNVNGKVEECLLDDSMKYSIPAIPEKLEKAK